METEIYRIAFASGGGLLGYIYYRLVGCRSGACPITSSPWMSVLFGAFLAFTLASGK